MKPFLTVIRNNFVIKYVLFVKKKKMGGTQSNNLPVKSINIAILTNRVGRRIILDIVQRNLRARYL